MGKHTDPKKRHDFVFLFDVENGNPNGDPDAGNLPRIDPETMHGLVTDVAIKRKVRDYLQMTEDLPIFIQSETALNRLIDDAARDIGVEYPQTTLKEDELIEWFQENQAEGFELDGNILSYVGSPLTANGVKKLFQNVEDKNLNKKLQDVVKPLGKKKTLKEEDRRNTQKRLIEKYYDIRMFGAVLSTGINAGQVRGPVQFTFAKSVHPIHRLDISITRKAVTKEEDKKSKENTMARKPVVPYGLYRAHGFYNPYLADNADVSEKDLEFLWNALLNMFEFDRAAARGQMTTQGLYVFSHENKRGNYPAHKLFKLIKPKLRRELEEQSVPPRSIEDYEEIEVDQGSVPKGVFLECF
ncbi:type I-C CRISPR-associated protein Cas7/Csd2 [Desulfonema magnum]|uniref:CRISPR-associated protein Cas7/Csd2, subtype I-C/DVULG n=1 Tax=Desulfonema magnum TaxID=45655 RepID=A0A975GU45_9BACT|nr:type I-C CRISPR-associated protein Cas7/Csd2 [Desulfonema magnum]QTA93780.1 CRISPR-associated protein Cas7/Csd2, subtype I-C/DVULG [Desulfonema magnum]